jgi:hypothetical protein
MNDNSIVFGCLYQPPTTHNFQNFLFHYGRHHSRRGQVLPFNNVYLALRRDITDGLIQATRG